MSSSGRTPWDANDPYPGPEEPEDADSVTYRARMYLTDADRHVPGRVGNSKMVYNLIMDMLEEIEALRRAQRGR